MKSSFDIITEALKLLYQERKWNKGGFFSLVDDVCLMCPHGAIAYCGNIHVQRLIKERNIDLATTMAHDSYKAGRYSEAEIRANMYGYCENIPLALAHKRVYDAGLSPSFNDSPRTQLSDIVKLLDKAAKFKINI